MTSGPVVWPWRLPKSITGPGASYTFMAIRIRFCWFFKNGWILSARRDPAREGIL